MNEKIKEIETRYKNENYVPDLMTTEEVESDVQLFLSHIHSLESRNEELEIENKRLSSEWQQTQDWNNQVISENQNLKARIEQLVGGEEK